MRKKDRDGIVELLGSIEEALIYCKDISMEEAGSLYEDCQAAINSILNTLRARLTDSEMVSFQFIMTSLEATARILQQVKAPLDSEFYESTINSLYVLAEMLQELELQYEVIFLPYNVTMWDSLESIWMAAKKDERCIPYVIPIPYFDKNADGTLGQMHYEAELFPDYVEVTNYLEYDIVNRRPDIIYFHNPYDRFNKVTSVHPLFYSNSLKKYTDLLVYVPYFMVMEELEEHFALLPGVRYADVVIVQSEQIAEEYRSFYPGEDKDKFLPLGSPKIDKIKRIALLGEEEIYYPEGWRERIGDRRVVFYNTHLGTIINKGDALIQKLRYVFACFQSREDVVLLWRPHPLSGSTAAALNPKIVASYQQMIEEFCQKGIGIYDDTPEVHRSLALADAYYGDRSSLVPIFGTTGKPVLIQNINLSDDRSYAFQRRLSFFGCHQEGEELWFAANEFNGLFRYDLRTDRTEFIAEFIGEDRSGRYLYSEVHRYGNKLFFIPRAAGAIAVFDMDRRQMRRLELDKMIDKANKHKFLQAVSYQNQLFLIPAYSKAIIRLNMDRETILYETDWYQDMEGYLMDQQAILFRQGSVVHDNVAYIPSCAANIIMELDMKAFQIKLHQIGQRGDSFADITYDGSFYYLIPRKQSAILKLHFLDGKVIEDKVYDKYPEGLIRGDFPFAFGTVMGKDLILYPMQANMALRLDTSRDEITEYDIIENSISNQIFYSKPWTSMDNQQLVFLSSDKQIYRINPDGKLSNARSVNLPDCWDEQFACCYIRSGDLFHTNMVEKEEGCLSLKVLMDFITKEEKKLTLGGNNRKEEHNTKAESGTVGNRIHEYIMGYCNGAGKALS